MKRLVTTILASFLGLSSVAPLARADDPPESIERMTAAERSAPMLSEAQSRFRVGLTLYQANRYLEAAREFEESYRLTQQPEVLYNVYVSYRDAGDWVAAANALRQYLAATPTTLPERTTLEQRLANIEQRLAELEASIRARTEQVVAAEAAAEAERREAAEAEAAAERAAAEEAAANRPRSPHWSGYAVVGVGAAALIAGSVTGFLTMQTAGDLDEQCPGGFCPESARADLDSARTFATTTDVLLIGGGVAAAAGVLMLLLLDESPDETSDISASAGCAQSGCSASFSVRF